MVLEFDAFDDHLVWIERVEGQRVLRVLDRRSREVDSTEFGRSPHVVRLAHNPDPSAPFVQFTVATPSRPATIWRYAFDTRTVSPLKASARRVDEPERYRTERIRIQSRDGEHVPVTLIAHPDTRLDGRAPLLVEAYGAYGLSLEPDFDPARSSLLDRGFVIALAHVRGGQERGRRWYDEGRGSRKSNSIHDLIDVVGALRASGRIDGNRVYARGSSAGGMLVAAAANMVPQYFDAIVARVPFVDVVQTMLDPSLPLTTQEYLEWGNPQRADELKEMLDWSPYQNVARQDYPAMFVTASLWDAQVPYWVPVKWVARLRAMRNNREPLLLQIDLDHGHDGSGASSERRHRRAMEVAFLLDRAGCAGNESCAGSD
jgi:oligopeptidase B